MSNIIEIKTHEDLMEAIPYMPRWMDRLLYPNGFPLPPRQIIHVSEALDNYYRWIGEQAKTVKGEFKANKSKRVILSSDDIEMLKQYIIYYIHAPLWLRTNAYEPDENPIQEFRRTCLSRIKDLDTLRDFKYDLLHVGLDPF
mgnify:FL=1